MKVSIIHKKANTMEALQVTKDRMDEIVEVSQKKMVEKYPTGTKTQMLDFMLRECLDVNEVVATTIVWVAMTNQMAERERYNKMKEEAAKVAFANKLKINR